MKQIKLLNKIASIGINQFDKSEFEVSMRAGYVVIPKGNLRYNQLFNDCVIAGRG